MPNLAWNRRMAWIGLALVATALRPAPAPGAQVCDFPLQLQAPGVLPNVMILLDSSTSMREAIYHRGYDPAVVYSGPFEARTSYSVISDGLYSPNSWDSNLPTTPTAPLVNSEADEPGSYQGNYLNWIFYHATDEERADLPQTTRFEVAKAALVSVVTQVDAVRWGITKFNGNNGGTIVSGVNQSLNSFLSQIESIKSDAWTPAAESMVDLIDYFSNNSATSAPIQHSCQSNFIVFISDGYPTQDRNLPYWIGDQDGDDNEPGSCTSIGAPLPDSYNCSDYLDDVAYYMAHTDLRPDLPGDQVVNTYTIQLSERVPLLVDAAENGGGAHFFAWDLEELIFTLRRILANIEERISAASAVTAVAGEQFGEGTMIRSKFLPVAWRGYLESYDLPYQSGDTPTWEAGALLTDRAPTDRDIFTFVDGAERAFDPSAAADFAPYMGLADVDSARSVMRYTRGEPVAGLRDREGWKLGDIVNSAPLVVGPPSRFVMDASYQQFLEDYSSRQSVVYVGANDGMMHAFSADTGHELWAYVPQGVMRNLPLLAAPDYCHLSFVDLSPTVYDLRIGGAWRTVLFGGLRNGGENYFAIDVTNPTSPQVLWETAVPEVVRSFSRPQLITRQSGNYLWVGSGPDPGGQASIAVLDAATGNVMFTGLAGAVYSEVNMASDAVTFDTNWDGVTDRVYHGDLAGNLWRWDVSAATPSSWTGTKLFTADGPIQGRPSVTTDESGNVLVYFGTGRFVGSEDILDLRSNRFYCVIDDGQVEGLTSSDLVDQTSTIVDMDGAAGWRIDLVQEAGERVTEPASIVAGVVYFTSYAVSGTNCERDYRSWLYSVDFLTGAGPGREDTAERVEDIGSGMASAPVPVPFMEDVLVQLSNARLSISDLRTAPDVINVRAWREVFQK